MAQRNDFDNLPKQFLQAARTGNVAMVSECLENHVDINTQDPQTGETALHLAVLNGCHDMVNILLENSLINPNILDHDGFSPLIHALRRCIRHSNSAKIAESLIASSKVNCDMEYPTMSSETNTATKYINYHCDRDRQALMKRVLTEALMARRSRQWNLFNFFTTPKPLTPEQVKDELKKIADETNNSEQWYNTL